MDEKENNEVRIERRANRRRFLKRGGGVTAGALLGLQSLKVEALCEEGSALTLKGYKWEPVHFEDLIPGLVDDIQANLTTDKRNTFANGVLSWIQGTEPEEEGWLKTLWNGLVNEGIDTVAEVRAWVDDYKAGLPDKLTTYLEGEIVPDYVRYTGFCSQLGEQQSGPGMTGGGTLINRSETWDAEISGWGLKLTVDITIGDSFTGNPSAGFNLPGTSTATSAITEATIADIPKMVGSLTVKLTIGVVTLSITLNDEEPVSTVSVDVEHPNPSIPSKPTAPITPH